MVPGRLVGKYGAIVEVELLWMCQTAPGRERGNQVIHT